MNAEAIPARMSSAQKLALAKLPSPTTTRFEMSGDTPVRHWNTASELGVRGKTLMSMNGLGGVDPDTLQIGPILCTWEWGESGRRLWSITDLGLEVKSLLPLDTGDAR